MKRNGSRMVGDYPQTPGTCHFSKPYVSEQREGGKVRAGTFFNTVKMMGTLKHNLLKQCPFFRNR
jgi:hypothetical protein